MRESLSGSLVDAAPRVFWLDRPERPEPSPPLEGERRCDLAIVGGGFTGLWAAIQAKEDAPDADVVVLEAEAVAHGASGRNGGFLDASLTHGLENGLAHFPREIELLQRLGRENLAAIEQTLVRHGIEADWEPVGELAVATEPHQVAWLEEAAELHREHGDDAVFCDRDEVRAIADSPTYLAGCLRRSNSGIVDPARLCWGLARAARSLGADVYEGTPVGRIREAGTQVLLETPLGRVVARRCLVATSAYPPPLRRIRRYVAPVYDYVLVTEPLSADRLAALGWAGRQGISDSGNRFHYYRLTADDRLLFGGYDAIYRFRGDVAPHRDQRAATFRLLAGHLAETFPQLEGVRFTHRWGGAIDTSTRFCVTVGLVHGGKTAYAVGYTGLGVGASRFGARAALDLLAGGETEITRLELVRRRPIPFPPEPFRLAAIELTRRALARADERQGRRGPWLRFLDRIGAGFDS